MGEKTTIGWTDHTFNSWWGCQKVSPGCTNCYAERDSHRRGYAVWGKDKPRRFFSDKHWAEPLKWDRVAAKAGERRRVFCSSMADVFEDRRDLDASRDRLWSLVEATPNLDWLLLTKRPENISAMLRPDWLAKPRANVWLGTTAEDQERADSRIPILISIPARVHFVSAEPLLGPVNLLGHMMEGSDPGKCAACGHGHGFTRCPNTGGIAAECSHCRCPSFRRASFGLGWVIVGGESGPNFRPLQEWWVRKVVDDCQKAHVPVFVKQMGRVVLVGQTATVGTVSATQAERLSDPKGADPSEWPMELRIREFPTLQPNEKPENGHET